MRKFLLCLLMALAFAAPVAAALPDDLKSVCVLVRADTGSSTFGFMGTVTGTGFFVAPDLLVTCAHLSRIPGVFGSSPAERFLVELEPGRMVQARLVMQDAARDLALLKVAHDTGGVPLGVKPFSLQSGQEVAIVGNFPASIQVTRGTVVAPTLAHGFALASAKVRGGFSGAPVFGPDGSVQGVLSQRDDDYNAIFVSSDVVLDLLRAYEKRTGRRIVTGGEGAAGGKRAAGHRVSRQDVPRRRASGATRVRDSREATRAMPRMDSAADRSAPRLADRVPDHDEDLIVAVPMRKRAPVAPNR